MLIVMTALSVVFAGLFSWNLAVTTLTFHSLLVFWPTFLITLIVYGQGHHRAFAIGAMVTFGPFLFANILIPDGSTFFQVADLGDVWFAYKNTALWKKFYPATLNIGIHFGLSIATGMLCVLVRNRLTREGRDRHQR